MLGQPASSQTVCRPSRRTSDFSSVYSGPVFSRVLIHSGLRSIGTWLLRTSRRRSLRPAGSMRGSRGRGRSGRLTHDLHGTRMTGRRPRCASAAGASVVGATRSGLPVVRACRRAGVGAAVGPVQRLGTVAVRSASSGTRRRSADAAAVCTPRSVSGGVASPALRHRRWRRSCLECWGSWARGPLGSWARARRRPARGSRRRASCARSTTAHTARRRPSDGEQPRPAPRLLLDADRALDLLGGRRRLLLEVARASCRPSCGPSSPSCAPSGRTSPPWRRARRAAPRARCSALSTPAARVSRALSGPARRPRAPPRPGGRRRRRRPPGRPPAGGRRRS